MIWIIYQLWSCDSGKQEISYNEHIRPIFNKNCMVCHGGVRQLGEFSLLFEETAFSPTESGKLAIVRGNHQRSELYQRIIHPDPEKRMPQEADALNEEEIDLIARWIDEGARWEKHWSFIPPEYPEIPETGSEWPVTNIDRFILKKLKKNGLSPAAEAERFRLIRRVSLDLTGLPPTPREVDAFVNDPGPDAYKKLVDRLLDSPHYGEKWASMWLDLARYADSKGYEKDPHRNIWRYRDWVIKAINNDLPFDQFTITQLAGDLLPESTFDQLIATGFHRNSMTNTEGGTEDEEFRVAAVIDRVNTTMEVWQGVTMGCVQCHDHPYDPIRQEEFYEQFAFFNNTQDADLDNDFPFLEFYTEEDAREIRSTILKLTELKPGLNYNPHSALSEQIKNSLSPRLLTLFADDFDNVIIRNNMADNSSANLNNQKDKNYHLVFSDIQLSGLTDITFTYSAEGDDAMAKVFLDSINGPLLCETTFQNTGATWDVADKFKSIRIPVTDHKGKHSIIIKLINMSGKAPDGLVKLKELFLRYKNHEYPSDRILELEERLILLQSKAEKNLVMKEKPLLPRKTFIFERGNWLLPGQEVTHGIPSSLGKFPEEHPRNRLGLARWLISQENPLTGRVMVNRYWEQLFGRGIVFTTEDFGTQGEPPSHPELLDYLSIQFSQTYKWSVKQILKEMVMSAAYRQSSVITQEKFDKDPYNQLLSRGPRFRLSAEQIRDQALAVSGLLDNRKGGESVMPPQPEGIWQVVYSGEKWETNEEDKYRRGIYTYWKRTSPYPSMISFDSPSREFCVSRRIRTNTPLQALVTLNDPVYIEISDALGKRMIESGNNTEESIKYGFKAAVCREPDDQTMEYLIELYKKALDEYSKKNYTRESKHLNIKSRSKAEKEAYALVANAIINLDEFLTKE